MSVLSPEQLAVLPYTVVVFQRGNVVSLPGSIADPIAPRASEYIQLHPGESRSFVLRWFREALEELPIGTYQIQVLLSRFPEPDAVSRKATFHVRRLGGAV